MTSTRMPTVQEIYTISLTEKACFLVESNQYTFLMDRSIKKSRVLEFCEQLDIDVAKIRIINLPVKMHKPRLKKVMITCKPGSSISIYPE